MGKELYQEVTAHVAEAHLTEVRLRLNRPIAVRDRERRHILPTKATRSMIDEVIAKATKYSLYAYQDEIASGYIHCSGGIRIGIAGRGVSDSGKIITYKEITSLNIRVPHEIIGAAHPLKNILNDYQSTIIIAPPFGGKTTLIRDMARLLSNNYDVAIIDEREEIGGRGEYKLGALADIISGVPKGLALEGIIRAMSPEIIVLDELFPSRDLHTAEIIAASGIKFLASLHGDSLDSFTNNNPRLARLFTYGILLSYKPCAGSIKSIVRFKFD